MLTIVKFDSYRLSGDTFLVEPTGLASNRQAGLSTSSAADASDADGLTPIKRRSLALASRRFLPVSFWALFLFCFDVRASRLDLSRSKEEDLLFLEPFVDRRFVFELR